MEKRKKGFLGVRSVLPCAVISALSLFLLLIALPLAVFVSKQQQKVRQHPANAVSPLIFGTNIGLFNPQDSFITQSSVRNLVKQMHISTLRIPVRQMPGGAPPVWPQAVQYAKDMGLIPLLILRAGVNDTGALAADTQIITTVNSVMGNNRVFYEFGNEEDLFNSTDQYHYAARWNQLVASLKRLAPNAWFGGPVTHQSNAPYVAYFSHHAHPRPDFISWHSYFCGPQSNAQFCIANIAHFAVEIASTKNAIQANGDSVPPIFITEWNYDASQGAKKDPRNTPQFQQQFVQKVLQEFAKDGVYAAYQYVLNSNPDFNLIDTNNTTLTPAGQEFQIMYERLIGVKRAKQVVAPLSLPHTQNETTGNPSSRTAGSEPVHH